MFAFQGFVGDVFGQLLQAHLAQGLRRMSVEGDGGRIGLQYLPAGGVDQQHDGPCAAEHLPIAGFEFGQGFARAQPGGDVDRQRQQMHVALQSEGGTGDDGLAAFVRCSEKLDRFLRRMRFGVRVRLWAQREVGAPDEGCGFAACQHGECRVDLHDAPVLGPAKAHRDGALAESLEQVGRLCLGLAGEPVERALE